MKNDVEVEVILITGARLTDRHKKQIQEFMKRRAFLKGKDLEEEQEILLLELPGKATVSMVKASEIITELEIVEMKKPRRGTKENPFEEGELVELIKNYTVSRTNGFGYMPKGRVGVVSEVDVSDSPNREDRTPVTYAVDFEGETIRGITVRYLKGVPNDPSED